MEKSVEVHIYSMDQSGLFWGKGIWEKRMPHLLYRLRAGIVYRNLRAMDVFSAVNNKKAYFLIL